MVRGRLFRNKSRSVAHERSTPGLQNKVTAAIDPLPGSAGDRLLDSQMGQTAMLETITRILLDDDHDLNRLLPRLLEKLIAQTHASGGAVFICSRHSMEMTLRAAQYVPQAVLQEFASLPVDAAFPDRILRVTAERQSRGAEPVKAALSDLLNHPSAGAMAIPLAVPEAAVGLIYLAGPACTENELNESYLAAVSRRVSRVIYQIQICDAAELRANKLTSLFAISTTMDRTFKLNEFLDLITQQAAQLLESESCCLALPNEENDALEIKSCYGFVQQFQDVRLGLNDTACGRVFLEGWPLVIDSVDDYPLIGARELDFLVTLKTAIIVPLLMKSRPLGALMIINKKTGGDFTLDDQELASAIANQAAMALENALLFEKVAHGKAEWENLFDSITDLITVQNKDSRIVRVNKAMAQRLGTTPRNLLGKSCGAAIHGAGEPSAPCPHAQVLSDLKHQEEEVALPHLDGVFTLSTFPLFDSHRKLYAYVHVLKEITLQKKLEQQLLQAQKMESMGTLAGGIAHDFNNILAAIIPNAQMIKRKLPSEDALYKRAEVIEQAARRAADLTSQVLSFSRKWKSSVTVLSPNPCITATIELLGRLIHKNITLETQLQDGIWNLEANETQIAQVLLNLALNACDAMPKGGALTFSTQNMNLDDAFCRTKLELKPGRYVCISVRDTGIGMKAEVLERVFEPFYTTKELGKGTGLGLAVVYGIVKNHSGTIEVQSEPGQGTLFKLYFPATDKSVRPEKAADEELPTGNACILVADDEEMVRKMVCELLMELGYQVFPAADGSEAVEIYRKRQSEIDLVILDMIMPKLDGGETFSLLKQINPNVRAVLSSGYSQEGKIQEVVKEGIAGFLQKPYSIGEIARVVRDALK